MVEHKLRGAYYYQANNDLLMLYTESQAIRLICIRLHCFDYENMPNNSFAPLTLCSATYDASWKRGWRFQLHSK